MLYSIFNTSMQTGFPLLAQGYDNTAIDLNTLLIKHPTATVFMTVDSSRYTKIGIFKDDILIIDRSLPVKFGDYVVFEQDGEFRIGRTDFIKTEVIITGVIKHVIHTVKGCYV